jgi:hypothetical protein
MMRRVMALLVVLLGALSSVPAGAQEWDLSNSIPQMWMSCDWWWNPSNVNTGQAQWEYWCYVPGYDMWTRAV